MINNNAKDDAEVFSHSTVTRVKLLENETRVPGGTRPMEIRTVMSLHVFAREERVLI
jgi:hypothetical protein